MILTRDQNLYQYVSSNFKKPDQITYKYEPLRNRYNISNADVNTIDKLVMLGLEYDDILVIPDYQRDLVWTVEQKQNLILSILYGNPIGDFLIKRENDKTKGEIQVYWTIIDGQQRINAIKTFVQGEFCLPNGDYFEDLLYWDVREFLFNYKISCSIVRNISYSDEIDLYLAKNTGGTAHTREEIEKARKLKV